MHECKIIDRIISRSVGVQYTRAESVVLPCLLLVLSALSSSVFPIRCPSTNAAPRRLLGIRRAGCAGQGVERFPRVVGGMVWGSSVGRNDLCRQEDRGVNGVGEDGSATS